MYQQLSKEMRIVMVCDYGILRSRYLCEFLRNEGYSNVDYGGVASLRGRIASWDMLRSADIIISAHPSTTPLIERRYKPRENQQLVQLDVADVFLPERRGS